PSETRCWKSAGSSCVVGVTPSAPPSAPTSSAGHTPPPIMSPARGGGRATTAPGRLSRRDGPFSGGCPPRTFAASLLSSLAFLFSLLLVLFTHLALQWKV